MKYTSTLFDNARNKIGSVVASANKDGNYFRAKVTPRNPKSPAQQLVRSSFTANSKAWRLLTDPERAGWVALAATVTLSDMLGNKYKPSGQQLYVGCNGNLATIGFPAIATAPATPDTLPPLSSLDLIATIGTAAPHTHRLSLQLNTTPADSNIACYVTPLFSAGRSFVGPGQFRYLSDFTGGASAPFDLTAQYEAMFGPLVLGAKLAVQMKAIGPNGFAGQPIRSTVIVSPG